MAVGYQLRGDVALVTLDRPDVYNSVDQTMAEELTAALARAGTEARALVVTGAGRAFCAGADLADLAADYEAGNPDLAGVIHDRFNPVIRALVDVPVPTVAAVNGVAAGAGIGLAMACDLRLGSEYASFISAFINVALIPDSGSTWFLTHSIGVSRAMEMAMTGRRVEAEEAAASGLLHRLVEDDVVEASLEQAGLLAEGPTGAYLATRRVLHSASAATLDDALSEEERVQGELGSHPAHLEGVAAFLGKRRPDFRST